MAAVLRKDAVVAAALMLALVVLAAAPGGARAAACQPAQLAVCASAITGGAKPTPGCCANLSAQQSCFCQYAKDPALGRYITSPFARKTLASCNIPVPHC